MITIPSPLGILKDRRIQRMVLQLPRYTQQTAIFYRNIVMMLSAISRIYWRNTWVVNQYRTPSQSMCARNLLNPPRNSRTDTDILKESIPLMQAEMATHKASVKQTNQQENYKIVFNPMSLQSKPNMCCDFEWLFENRCWKWKGTTRTFQVLMHLPHFCQKSKIRKRSSFWVCIGISVWDTVLNIFELNAAESSLKNSRWRTDQR